MIINSGKSHSPGQACKQNTTQHNRSHGLTQNTIGKTEEHMRTPQQALCSNIKHYTQDRQKCIEYGCTDADTKNRNQTIPECNDPDAMTQTHKMLWRQESV